MTGGGRRGEVGISPSGRDTSYKYNLRRWMGLLSFSDEHLEICWKGN